MICEASPPRMRGRTRMSASIIRFGVAASLLLVVTSVACRRGGTGYERDDEARPSTSSSAGYLDGMQLASARRVALESAVDAIDRRDLARLRQLDVWVRKRAQVPLFEQDDLRALELAISCLEHSPPPGAREELTAMESGTLPVHARDACLPVAPP